MPLVNKSYTVSHAMSVLSSFTTSTREIGRNLAVWDEWRVATFGVDIFKVRARLCRRATMQITCVCVRAPLCVCVFLCCAGEIIFTLRLVMCEIVRFIHFQKHIYPP